MFRFETVWFQWLSTLIVEWFWAACCWHSLPENVQILVLTFHFNLFLKAQWMFGIIYKIMSKITCCFAIFTHFTNISFHIIRAAGTRCCDLTSLHNLMRLFWHHVFESICVRVRFAILLQATNSVMCSVIYISVIWSFFTDDCTISFKEQMLFLWIDLHIQIISQILLEQ